jgi:hypothetical protein
VTRIALQKVVANPLLRAGLSAIFHGVKSKIYLRHRFLVHHRPLQGAIHALYLFAFDTRLPRSLSRALDERVEPFQSGGLWRRQ